MSEPKITYGFLIEKHRDTTGSLRVTARIVAREDDREHPRGVSGFAWELPRNLWFADFGLYGFVSSNADRAFIDYDPEYRDVFSVDNNIANRMSKTFLKVRSRIHKDHANEAGDVFLSVARALKLDFVVKRIGEPDRSHTYANDKWHFTDITTGRNLYRDLIDQARETVKLEAA